ncbi:MAG: ABC transporter permease subunit [Rhodospirillaceae bacterium]
MNQRRAMQPSAHVEAEIGVQHGADLIGAIVAEFVAARQGLGTMLQSAQNELDMALMLAVVFSLAVMGLAGNLAVRFLHAKVIFWEGRPSQSTTSEIP